MAKIQIPFLVEKKNRDGSSRFYWQPDKTGREGGWQPVSLGKDRHAAHRAAEIRNAEYARWKITGEPIGQQIRRRAVEGTFAALIARYRREYLNGTKPGGKALRLKPQTRKVYETALKRLEAWAGKQPVAYITPARIRVLRDANIKAPEDGGLGHAPTFNMLRVLRQVLAFAEAIEVIPKGSNPATRFDLDKPPPRNVVWTLEDDAAFDAAAFALNRPSLALARELALYSAQREADLIAFTEPQLQELEILEAVLRDRLTAGDGKVWGWCLSQGKTSTDYVKVGLEIPLEPVLLEKIRGAIRVNRARDRAADPPRLLTHVLVDDRTGKPWTARAFIRAWTEILEHAAKATQRPQMRELVWHDLRRTRVVRLRRRGMAKEMIASLTGHSLRSIEEMLKVYGPVDPTITAHAVVASLEPLPAPAEPEQEQSA